MKKFVLLHVGFEQPTPEIMRAWGEWFASIQDVMVDQGGFKPGREISQEGVADLAFDGSALTGFNIIEAPDLEAATEIASRCPYITAIRVYELRDG